MDPYKILEIDKNASGDDIKKAYRRLAKKYHPDTNNGDDTKFKQVNEAYKILTDKSYANEKKAEEFKKNYRGNPFGVAIS